MKIEKDREEHMRMLFRATGLNESFSLKFSKKNRSKRYMESRKSSKMGEKKIKKRKCRRKKFKE
jgi:hypothetical protein